MEHCMIHYMIDRFIPLLFVDKTVLFHLSFYNTYCFLFIFLLVISYFFSNGSENTGMYMYNCIIMSYTLLYCTISASICTFQHFRERNVCLSGEVLQRSEKEHSMASVTLVGWQHWNSAIIVGDTVCFAMRMTSTPQFLCIRFIRWKPMLTILLQIKMLLCASLKI